MRNVIAFVVALGVVVAIFWFTRSPKSRSEQAQKQTSTSTSTSTSTTETVAKTPVRVDKIDKVRRLDPEARKALGEQIARAREQARAKASETGKPMLEDAMRLEDIGSELKTQLEASIPILAACYEEHTGKLEAAAMMSLLGDPELGTVIDTKEIEDEDGKPLPAALDTCLRDAIDSLALPPLGPQGGRLDVKYTFKAD